MADTPTPSQAAEKAEMPVVAFEGLPTLPQSLLNTIGEYGMARTDRVSELEIQHRWLLLIAGIKDYTASALESQLAELRAEVERLKSVITEHNAECINQCEARKAAGTTQCPMKGYRRNCSDCPRDGMVDAALAADGKDGAR